MKEIDLQKKLWQKLKHRYIFLNTFFFKEESDWISFLPSGYCFEIEIKLSKADFKKDFRKKKHSIMLSVYNSKNPTNLDKEVPNRFWFFSPMGVISKSDVPSYAGLYSLDKWGRLVVVKSAPLLHRSKLKPERVFKKLYYLYEKSMFTKLFGDVNYPTTKKMVGLRKSALLLM